MNWPSPAIQGTHQRPYRDVMHHKCGNEISLHPATADLYARCPLWFANQPCSKCNGYHPVREFTWPDGQVVGT